MNLIFLITLCLGFSAWQLTLFVQSFKANTLTRRITLAEPIASSGVLSLELQIDRVRSLLGRASSKKYQKALFELPEIMDLLSVSLASGESVFNSIKKVVGRASGLVAKEFNQLIRAVEFGSAFEEELHGIAERLPQQQVIEFCNKLALAMRRGTPLAMLLREQSQSVRAEVHNQTTKQAGKNETRMMIPLVFLILPVTVLFAIFPSLQLLNLQAI